MRNPRTATKSSPHSPQVEKACAQQRKPKAAINKEIKRCRCGGGGGGGVCERGRKTERERKGERQCERGREKGSVREEERKESQYNTWVADILR